MASTRADGQRNGNRPTYQPNPRSRLGGVPLQFELHLHWLNSYDSEGSPSGPITWHRDFADARNRLREWVSTSGTRLDRDRPTRQTAWPGEEPTEAAPEVVVEDREADFVQFVLEGVEARRRIEERVRAAS